ncbi:uncharacterized protein LOC116773082 isoform X1 [Danaus plexippus]|uniref:uncharacterized protein LOC116773082 isoform X1 n=2 Tax=Danaus plexippus TaxID=13037 RepID=UPI002AB22F6E|nr:uncharacterized protein LOC116773082 isoform X1 [Danaus plexippus]
MSFLSASENVGFSGISQNISDASCATQYKMAVESVSGGCSSEVNMFIQDSSGDEQSYISHISDSFFHTKFKIDPSELYTFHDSDVIAGEITVSHTDDNYLFPESSEYKSKFLGSSLKEIDLLGSLTNGEVNNDKKHTVTNGHYSKIIDDIAVNETESKPIPKGQKLRNSVQSHDKVKHTISSPTVFNNTSLSANNSKTVVSNGKNIEKTAPAISPSETFLDVFKREQGVTENTTVKNEPTLTPIKPPIPIAKKQTSGKTKSVTPSKPRKGRGPTIHEALQRIPLQRNAVALKNTRWQAPGEEMFQCGPLSEKKVNAFRQLDTSSSDDDNMPEFEIGVGPVCVEESAAESRGARLALRSAAMRRHVVRAATSLKLSKDHSELRALTSMIKKQLSGQSSTCRLPPQTLNYLLAKRGLSDILSQQERRWLRQSGWSGGESIKSESSTCAEERCTQPPLPSSRYCLSHVTLAPEQRLYAACAAVFAGGERCKQPLLPLQEQTPLCTEHAWKRDNYELLSRESKPKSVRKRVWSVRPARPPRPQRRPKRRRRAPVKNTAEQSLSEINVCSNSSTYDSSEDTAMGGLSESEYMTASASHELEVGQVPPDDILDPSVLSQIPDEEFTEFFNQAESGASFVEGSELVAALEAVLDDRPIDIDALATGRKIPIHTAVSMESSSTPS